MTGSIGRRVRPTSAAGPFELWRPRVTGRPPGAEPPQWTRSTPPSTVCGPRESDAWNFLAAFTHLGDRYGPYSPGASDLSREMEATDPGPAGRAGTWKQRIAAEGRVGRCRRPHWDGRAQKRGSNRRPDGAGGGHGPGGRGVPIPFGPGAHPRGAPGARGPSDRGGGLARPGPGTRALGRAGRGLRRRCLARRRRTPRRLWRRASPRCPREGGGRGAWRRTQGSGRPGGTRAGPQGCPHRGGRGIGVPSDRRPSADSC